MQPDDEPTADVEIVARVATDELRFHLTPEVRVGFPGTGERESRQVTSREHIETPVDPGETYQRVVVTTRISSRLLYRDALDEERRPPASDPTTR